MNKLTLGKKLTVLTGGNGLQNADALHEHKINTVISSGRAFLKRVCHLKRNTLLILNLPENNLDIESHIEVARLIAECVNSGVRVMLATHSDFIIQEIRY